MKEYIKSGDHSPDFETKKTKYFSALALKIKEAFKMHKAYDLLAKNEWGVKDWRNASQHQLVVAARTQVLSRLMGFSEKISDEVFLAAGVHDFFKRKTFEKTPKGASMSMRQQIEADQEAAVILAKAQFPENVINLTEAIGSSPETIRFIKVTLQKGDGMSEQELAALAVHYVDDFTRGSGWAKSAEINEQGKKINDLNRRLQDARHNPKYKGVDEEGREYFKGKTAFDTQEEVGEKVEKYLARRLSELTGNTVDPKDLPILIDMEIKKTIEQS